MTPHFYLTTAEGWFAGHEPDRGYFLTPIRARAVRWSSYGDAEAWRSIYEGVLQEALSVEVYETHD